MENEKKQKYGIEVSTPFRHSIEAQLRFNDMDMLGHLNNSVYFTLFDLGKSDYFNKVRGENINWKQIDVVIANINCDFMAQTFYHEPIAVRTQTLRMGERSLQLVQQVYNTATLEVKAQCTCVMVSFDIATGTSKPLSDAWRSSIEAYEGRKF